MFAKPVVVGLFAAACITAAAGGAYVAVRENDAARPAASPAEQAAPVPAAAPVAETEALVAPPTPEPKPSVPAVQEPVERPSPRPRIATPATRSPQARVEPREAPRPAPAAQRDAPVATPAVEREAPVVPAPPPATPPPAIVDPLPEPTPAPPQPQIVQAVVPASSVVGLKVETSLSSETARVEDRVEARVTREVLADGRVAIPAGARVLGDVILVERGGKMKTKARLGVRFHTLVLANGNSVPFRTDAIFREGSSPGSESARKIGGAAIGGAVLGAIIGGAKGAAIGGATGAGAGGAVVMAGDRNPATLPFGTVVTVRLTSPVSIDVEKDL
jgi:hypothetical protein